MKIKKLLTGLLAAVFAIALCAGLYILAVQSNPGSQEDPLVSLSYVTDVLTPQMERYVDEQIRQTEQAIKFELDAKINAFAAYGGSGGDFFFPPVN